MAQYARHKGYISTAKMSKKSFSSACFMTPTRSRAAKALRAGSTQDGFKTIRKDTTAAVPTLCI